jgi:conserved hypothetical protein
MFKVDIIGTGSTGNAVVIDDKLLIDCGLTFDKLGDKVMGVEHIFITHRHGDHIKVPTLSKIYKDRPWVLREGLHCNSDVAEFIKLKNNSRFKFEVPSKNIFTEHGFHFDIELGGKKYHIETFKLYHDVPNQGFVITNEDGETLLFATDTNSMISAPRRKYDYLVVEGNYDEDKVVEASLSDDDITAMRAQRNLRHLSVQSFENFVRAHSKEDSVIYQLHESDTFGVSSEFGVNNN